MALKQSWDDDSGADFGAPTTTSIDVPDPFAGQSMAGGNATTERPPFGAAGSPSEGTALVEAAAIHDFGDVGQVHTALGDVPHTDTDTHHVHGQGN